MSTKEHRLSSLCAKQAFLPVSQSSRGGLKAALGAQARIPVFGHGLKDQSSLKRPLISASISSSARAASGPSQRICNFDP
jgi:hypothetical protein